MPWVRRKIGRKAAKQVGYLKWGAVQGCHCQGSGNRFDHDVVFLKCVPLDGGDEARRLCGLLARMMLRACERRSWSASLLDEQGWSMRIEGSQARLSLGEAGLHKFVTREGKTDKRHTSHCKIEAIQASDQRRSVAINEHDVEFKAQKCGGPGGQHVNKTESAVRALHRPSGISVLCSSERSQAENRRIAFQWLQAKLDAARTAGAAQERRTRWADSIREAGGASTRSYWLAEDRCMDAQGRIFKASAVLGGACETSWGPGQGVHPNRREVLGE